MLDARFIYEFSRALKFIKSKEIGQMGYVDEVLEIVSKKNAIF